MHSPAITKYAFRIRTRMGSIVDNLMIHGRDEGEAQRKLNQMYRGCEILNCVCLMGTVRVPAGNFEEVANLITR